MPPRSPRAPETGLTVVEVVAALALLALVVGGLLPLLSAGQLVGEQVEPQQAMGRTARVALDKLLRELRAAESFRTLAPGVIRFTLFWGDGTGAAPTVEYVLDSTTGELQYRWRDNWDYRRQIRIQAYDAVPAGYSVSVQFDHAALVAAGRSLANGNDVRVRYWTGARLVELDRVVDPDPLRGWNRSTTRVWFRLQAPIPSGATDAGYSLSYGNPAALAPPENGDHVFLDDEDGRVLYQGEWVRRDTRSGSYSGSPQGLRFQAASGTSGYRQLSKALPNDNVEILWVFTGLSTANNTRQVGIGARLDDVGQGYWVTPGRGNNNRGLRLWRSLGWGSPGNALATDTNYPVTINANTRYVARLQLVGSTFRARVWREGADEDVSPWLAAAAAVQSAGAHISVVNGESVPMDHLLHRIVVRRLVAQEPVTTLGPEASGARTDPPAVLGGPFRLLDVACFTDRWEGISCANPTLVRGVEVTLVARDPAGRVPDVTFRGRAMRQSP
jgi:hypothetical protein